MCTRIKLPFFKIEIKHSSMFYYILLNLIFIVIPAIGYIMNFQNLWEYFPPEEAFTTLESFYTIVSMKFIVACIGVFISPVGTIAGFIWQEKHAMNFFSFVRDSFSFKNKKKTETKKQKPYKNPCDDVKFGDIVIGRSFSEKTIYVDRYIGYNGYDNEYIPPYEGEFFDYEDIEKFSEKRLAMYVERGYDVIDFRDELVSNNWQLP